MSETPENPSAFPLQPSNDDDRMKPEYGMSLRDYFAGQALAGLCANATFMAAMSDGDIAVDGADAAYDFADAMLFRRAGAE